MLRIFAKLGTDEKVAVYCYSNQITAIGAMLNKQFGREWIFVECVPSMINGIKFNDGQIYKGFEVNKEIYSSAIIKIIKNDSN